jgi:hypothetical protein
MPLWTPSPDVSLSLPLQTALDAPFSLRRELIVLAAALVFGLLAAPPLVWVVGSRALGPYAGGGIGSFLASFYRGLASGTFGNWMIALGPYLLALVLRALLGIGRGAAAAD